MTTPPSDEELSLLIREQATHYKASSRLRTDIRARVVVANARLPSGDWLRACGLQSLSAKWRHLSLGMVCGVLVTTAAALLFTQLRMHETSAHEMVAAHVQALRMGPLYVVASSDRHTVKPWFQGRLDFAPPVPDLSAAGFVLLGGRIDQLSGEPTAVLVYAHKLHTITTFIRPGTQRSDAVAANDNGFRVLSWGLGAMKISAVSDMGTAEFNTFRDAWLKSL